MSYVYCGHCGARGHNRLGCPKRKMEAIANPDGYIAKQIEREQETRKRAVANRKCSYCSSPGHNRRGCPVLKKDMQTIQMQLSAYRHKFLNKMQTHGLGVGSLIQTMSSSDPDYRVLHLIESIDWEEINHKLVEHDLSGGYAVENKEKNFLRTRIVSHNFPDNWQPSSHWQDKPKIMSKSVVSAEFLYGLFGEELINIGDRKFLRVNYQNFDAADASVKVLGPVGSVTPPPSWLNPREFTFNLAKKYNFKASGNSPWEKARRGDYFND